MLLSYIKIVLLTVFSSNKRYSIQKKTSDSNNNNKQKNKRRENADKIWTRETYSNCNWIDSIARPFLIHFLKIFIHKEKTKAISILMRVFISDKATAKLYVQFLDQNNPKCRNELIYVRDFEAVQKPRSRILSLIKHSLSFFKHYVGSYSRSMINPYND